MSPFWASRIHTSVRYHTLFFYTINFSILGERTHIKPCIRFLAEFNVRKCYGIKANFRMNASAMIQMTGATLRAWPVASFTAA